MRSSSDLRETQLATALTEQTSTGRLQWTIRTPGSLHFKSSSIPTDFRYCYEASLGDKTLVLFDTGQNAFYSFGALAHGLHGGPYSLSIFDKSTRSEVLKFGGTALNDLYRTVSGKTGTADSVIDDLLSSAKRLG